jgi:FtsH-binding integral membrane protein
MENKIYSKVYLWLFVGLLVTFLTGAYTATNEDALAVIFSKGFYWIFVIGELGLAIFLSARIHKMQPTTAKISYLLYTFFSGLTFASLFVVYKLESIILVFAITAILFLIFAVIGHFTKMDLSKVGTYLIMMLIGVIICTIVNLFLQNSTFDIIISVVSIIVFLGFIAYDVQKLKRLNGYLAEDNLAIIGAFELYLDFINIFIDLLRLFGKSDD